MMKPSAEPTKTSPKPRRGRPRGTPHTRERILAGAVDAFARDGYERTTVEDILEHARISRATFYRFFHNKEEIFTEIVKRAIALMLLEIEQAIERPVALFDKLEAGIETYLRACMAAGPLARIVLIESMPPESEAAQTRTRAMQRIQETIQREIQRNRGEIVNPLVLHGLTAALDAVAVRLATERSPGEWDLEQAKRVMLRVMGATLSGEGDPVPSLPLIKPERK